MPYELLTIDKLKIDGGVQPREGVDVETVKRYALAQALAVQAGGSDALNDLRPDSDPVMAFDDGKHLWLADGFHWVEAARSREGHKAILRVCVRKGTKEDALIYALGRNETHGKAMTRADKEHKVRLALAQWPDASTNMIAERCRVSDGLVERIRSTSNSGGSKQRVGKDGKARKAKLKKPASGSTSFNWREHEAVFGRLVRQVDELGRRHDAANSIPAKGLRRLLSEFDKAFKDWGKALAKEAKRRETAGAK